jgi:VWFA-related protein
MALLSGDGMTRTATTLVGLPILLALPCVSAWAQSPSGPVPPKPGVEVQLPPPSAQAKVRVRVALVTTPVTVRNKGGEMVHDLEAHEFRVTDNGVAQQISHFDLGGDPLSVVILIETSSHIEPLLPEIRKTGILLTQTVMGSTGEAAVVGFDDSVDKLQNFTTNPDLIEGTIAHLRAGTSGSKLCDAMTVGVEMLSDRPLGTPDNPGRRRVLLIVAEANYGEHRGSEAKLGEVLRQAQLANVTIYSVGLSTTRAELQAKPKPAQRPSLPVGSMPAPPGTVQTPTSEENRYGNIDLMAAAVWAVQHIHDQVKDHPLEIAATATGGAHLPTFKDRTIEKAIDEIGGELHSQYAISYAPSESKVSGYHEIKVSVLRKDAKNLKVRSRPGYYLAESEN